MLCNQVKAQLSIPNFLTFTDVTSSHKSYDMTELGITLTNEQGVLKNLFNNFVKKKVKLNMLKYFSEMKKSHSKAKNLKTEKFEQAEYIRDSRFTTFEKQLLYKLTSKTLDVKQNCKGLNNNLWCTSCCLFRETQGHLLHKGSGINAYYAMFVIKIYLSSSLSNQKH